MKPLLVKTYHLLVKVSWAAFFFTLPFTSFPYFPSGLGGKTLVRPLSTYPLIILCILVTLPRLIKRPVPRTFLPLLAFILLASISTVASLAADIESLHGVTLLSRLARSLATLGLGAAFYFTTALLPQTWDDLRFSFRWLYAGFALALAWGSLQALYVIYYHPAYFNLLNHLQSFISGRKLFATRISGLTYEPKWFAEQICLFILPWLLGAILSRQKLFGSQQSAVSDQRSAIVRLEGWMHRRFPITRKFHLPQQLLLEWLYLAWAAVVLLFTYSRTGLVILGILVILSFVIFRGMSGQRSAVSDQRSAVSAQPSTVAQNTVLPAQLPNRPITQSPKSRFLPKRFLPKRFLLEISAIICGLIVLFVLVGSQNPYFSRFWRYFTEAKQRNRSYLEYIAFDQRFTYWQTAFIMFESQPLIGVGLGNYAFYFEEMLPDRFYRLPEIIRQTTPEEGRDRLITPKNLLARLLAETGILGTAAFISFLIAIVGCVLFLSFHPSAVGGQLWAIGGALALVVSALVIFSMDSFARPEIWVVFGLITAAAHMPTAGSAAPQPQEGNDG